MMITFHGEIANGAVEGIAVGSLTGGAFYFISTVLAHIGKANALMDRIQGRAHLELEDLGTLVQQLPGVEDIGIAPVVLVTLTQHHRVKQSGGKTGRMEI